MLPVRLGGRPAVPEALLPGYDLTVLDGLDGLPSTTVRAIALDRDGAMWLGTFGGLCRYDGHEFHNYLAAETEGLESDRIASLHLDSHGVLWIGTELGPVSLYVDGKFEVFVQTAMLSSVGDFLEGQDGAIWMCGNRLARWKDGDLDMFDLAGEPLNRFVRAIEELENGDLLIASLRGLERFSPDITSIDEIEQVPLGTDNDLDVAGFFRDPRGDLWITNHSCASVRFNGSGADSVGFKHGRVYSCLPFDDGTKLLSCETGLELLLARSDGSLDHVEVARTLEPRSMLITGDGTLWIGAVAHGLLRCRPREFEFANLGEETGLTMVIPGPRDRPGDVIITRLGGASARVSLDDSATPGGASRSRISASVPLPNSRDGLTTPNGDYWIATGSGVAKLVDGQFEQSPGLKGDVDRLVVSPDGVLWASIEGVFREVLIEEMKYGHAMRDLFVSPSAAVTWPGGFLCASSSRLIEFDVETRQSTMILRLPGVELRALCVDDDGTLWITTYGDGLYRRRPDGTLDHWTSRDGLPSVFLGWVGRLVVPEGGQPEDRDFLWVNSNSGAIRIDTASLDRVASGLDDMIATRLVRMSEGNGVSGAALPDGRLALPTIHGLALVDPTRLQSEQVMPRIMIDEVRVDGALIEGVLVHGEFLGHDSPPRGVVDLEFAYSGILFPTARGVTFQYRLDGYDADWIDAGTQRVARYTNLSPGEYTFRLRARSRDGPWSPTPAVLSYEVLPYWYQRWPIQVLFVTGLITALVLGVRWCMRAVVERADVLEQEVERRRLVETDLRASRAEHLSVLEAAQSGVVTIQEDGVISYANPAISGMFGWPRDEIVGTHLSILRMEMLRDSIEELLQRSPGDPTGEWDTVETKAEHADGTTIDLELALSRHSNGSESYAICIVRDVSERKRMTDKLRRSEERYRTLFRTAPAAIVVWGPDFEIMDWNERAQELFGWSRDDAIGSDFTELFGLDSVRNPLRMAATRVLSDTKNHSIVYVTKRQDHTVRLCRWGFTPLLNPDGSLRAVISVATDITDEQNAARDLDNLRKRLVRAEETERSRIARELHDDLSQRLAALALDMQMALDDIAGFSEADIKGVLRSIQEGLQAVSTDVHALSRKLHPTVLDDLGLSRALRSECTRRSRGQSASISFVDETQGVEVPKDVALSLFRIAQESMQNATKHASANEIVVRLREVDGRVTLEIRDDGVGFDPSALGGHGEGGLGLASMRERARLVNADFTIRADDRLGTCVTVVVDAARQGAV